MTVSGSNPPRRGDIWAISAGGIDVLVISSTVYNDIPSEPTIIVVPIFDHDPDTGFGVPLGDGQWAAPGLVTSLRKTSLLELRPRIDVHVLSNVNNMLFRILATPDR